LPKKRYTLFRVRLFALLAKEDVCVIVHRSNKKHRNHAMNALPFDGFKYEIPEDVTKSSHRVMNFWVGAMSPLWLPFVAASSFGIGAWMLTKGMSEALTKRGEDLNEALNELPLMQGLVSMEKAVDEAVSAPLKAFVEAETLIADRVIGDYSAPPEAVEAALKAEEAATPRPMAQKLAVAPQRRKKPAPL
jgi:hypothetical protein